LQASKKSEIKYISLFREHIAGKPSGPVMAKVSDVYSGIDPNDIAGTLDKLYDEEVKRNFGGPVK